MGSWTRRRVRIRLSTSLVATYLRRASKLQNKINSIAPTIEKDYERLTELGSKIVQSAGFKFP
jgi:hypothetical protein